MVAEPIPDRISKMPPKKKGFLAAQKKKAKSGNAMFRAAKEASDLAVANGEPNPTPGVPLLP